MDTKWEVCYSAINLLSFLNWLTYEASPEEAFEARLLPIVWHKMPEHTDGQVQRNPGVWVPIETGRMYHEMKGTTCQRSSCWRCGSKAGGFAFHWQNAKWTPRCARLDPEWFNLDQGRKERLKSIAYTLADRAPFPIGTHKAPQDANWGWDTGFETDGTDVLIFTDYGPRHVRFVRQSPFEKMHAERLAVRRQGMMQIYGVSLLPLTGQPKPMTRPVTEMSI